MIIIHQSKDGWSKHFLTYNKKLVPGFIPSRNSVVTVNISFREGDNWASICDSMGIVLANMSGLQTFWLRLQMQAKEKPIFVNNKWKITEDTN